ncbi:MAG: hypothetical protein ACJ8AW_32100 [Rhodopila sp.]
MPIHPDIRARMCIFLSGRDREFWPRDLVTAAEEGRWTIEEALAYLHELNTRPVVEEAAQSETALSRPRPRRRALLWGGAASAPEPTNCYVPAISFAPVVDFRLSDGCLRFLAFLRARIGRGERWRVLTGSIAKQLGRTRRTILNYIHEAVPAGLLISEFDRRTGITTLRLTEQMEPPPPKPPQADRTPWPREPKPALWWPKAAMAALRKGGGKLSAAINSKGKEREFRNKAGAQTQAT